MQIRDASCDDIPAIQALLPLLASFDVPLRRNPEHLWRGDEEMLLDWGAGKRGDVFVRVAVQEEVVAGACIVSLREELLSHEPSAHLEVVVVSQNTQGTGLGRKLMCDAEMQAQSRGAWSMTLHVFGVNKKARGLYDKLGYDPELIRYSKTLDAS